MEVGDIININASYGGYWKGKITSIDEAWKHTYKDGSEYVIKYTKPIATVQAIEGSGYTVVIESDLEIKDGETYEKGGKIRC